jgi:hypothetical protein
MGSSTARGAPCSNPSVYVIVMNQLHVKDREFRNLYNTISIEQLLHNANKRIPRIEVDASAVSAILRILFLLKHQQLWN